LHNLTYEDAIEMALDKPLWGQSINHSKDMCTAPYKFSITSSHVAATHSSPISSIQTA